MLKGMGRHLLEQACPRGWTLALSAALISASAIRTDAENLSFAANIDPKMIVANHLVQMAMDSVRNVPGAATPTRLDQFVRARIFLELALQLAPNDAEIWHLRFELAKQTNDTETKINAISEICRINPENDAAQLELIMMLIDQRQMLEQRVQVATQFLVGAKSEKFSKPLRSRLASFAAQGAAEIGDKNQFKRYLAMSLKLDPTNRQAAHMAYDQIVARQPSSIRSVGLALINLIAADPFNAELRIQLGRLLLGEGLYQQSTEQFSVADRITPQTTAFEVLFDWCLGLAATGEFDRVIELSNGADEALVKQYQQQRRIQLYREQQKKAPDGETVGNDQTPPPSIQRQPLPLDLELLRLTILHRSGYKAKADGAYGRLADQLSKRIAAGDTRARNDLVWHSVLFDRYGSREQALYAQLTAQDDGDQAVLARIQGWIALNNGQREKAGQILKQWIDRDPMAAYGMALTCNSGDTAIRTEFLQKAAAGAYGHLAGLLSTLELADLDLQPDPTEDGKLIASAYGRWPNTWRNPDPQASPLIQFSLTPRSNQLEYLDPLTVTLRLRNASDVPLPLGEDEVLPTNVFLVAAMHPIAGGQIRDLPPTVVNLRRRLTIDPDETLTVTTSLDRSNLGGILNRTPLERIGFSLAAFLDPKPQQDGSLAVGPLGSIDREPNLQRVPYPDSDIENWFLQLSSPDPIDRLSAVARLNRVLPRMFGIVEKLSQTSNGEEEDEEEKSGDATRRAERIKVTQTMMFRISNELITAFEKLEPYEQTWMCFFLGDDESSVNALRPIHQSAQKTDDPMVRITYLATQIHTPDSPRIDSDLRHAHPMIREFAESHRTWIIETQKALAELRQRQIEYQRQQQRQR